MSRIALSVALALGWGSLGACAVSASAGAGSAPGDMSQGAGSQGKPARVVEGSGAAEGGAGAPSAPPPCEPALADVPTALFGTKILVRMPKGVELVEQNPFFAQAAAPDQATNCGPAVSYAAIGYFEYPNATVTAVRDQVLELRGIEAAGLTWEDEGTRGRTYTGAYSAPADEATGTPAVRGWFVLRDTSDKYGYFALYEAEPAAWEALKGVFVASGRSLLIKQRRVSTGDAELSAGPPAGGASGGGGAGAIAAEPASAKPTKGKTKAKAGARAD